MAKPRESWEAPLVESQLTPTSVRSEWIRRPELWDELDGTPDTRVILVAAPGGYGKSALVAQWLTERQIPGAWLSLTRSERDPAVLLNSLGAAITHAFGLELAPAAPRSQIDLVAGTRQINRALATLAEPVTIVLDNYHIVEGGPTNELVDQLLEHLPSPHRLVVISNGHPKLSLACMRSDGVLVELGARELALSPDQARDLLVHSHAPHLTLGEIDALVVRCQGWLAGLRLIIQNVGRMPEAPVRESSAVHFDEYFTQGTYANLEPDLRSYLVRTSILDRFTVELSEAALQRSGAREAISRLVHAGVYLFGPEGAGWYRYHPLFAEFLRTELRSQCSEEEILASHRLASRWLEERGLIEEAAQHAVAGRDWDRATGFVEELARGHWHAGRIFSARTWIEHLPPEIIASHAELSYWLSGGLIYAGQISAARGALSQAETLWTESGQLQRLAASRKMHGLLALTIEDGSAAVTAAQAALDLLPEHATEERWRASVLLGAGFTRTGRLEQAERAFESARATSEDVNPGWMELEPIESAELLMKQGRLSEAATIFTHIRTRTDEARLDSVIRAHLSLASIDLERDLLTGAEGHLTQAEYLIERIGESRSSARLHLVRAQVAWAEGDAERALASKELAMSAAVSMGSRYLVRQVKSQEAQFWIESGEFPLVRRWAEESGLMLVLPADSTRAFELFTLLRALLEQGRGADLVLAAERIQHAAEESGLESSAAAFRTIRALALFEQGAKDQACALMRQSLHWAERERSVRMVAQYGSRVIPLLQYVSSCFDSDSYGSYLAGEASRAPFALARATVGDSRLTPRELEVLRLVSTGKSNRVIGDRLFISEGTVKKHLASILTKLRADNRTEAVANARRIGLI